MFINKIINVSSVGFKGYNHKKNEVGETVMNFNYPYDFENEVCEVQFFKVKRLPNFNYQIDDSKPIYTVNLTPEGVGVDLQSETDLDAEEAFAYKVVRKDKDTGRVIWEGPDTGVRVRKNQKGEYEFRVHQKQIWEYSNENNPNGREIFNGPKDEEYNYTLVTRKGTTPIVQGAGYLIMPDSFRPGTRIAKFNEKNTGEIVTDKAYQKEMEGIDRTFSNKFGGNIAGIIEKIPYLVENGYKNVFLLPIANGDNVSSHGYWNKNNMQVSPTMGTLEDYKKLTKELFRNGRTMVFDGTFTSEGLEGVHVQYAQRWTERNPQTKNWFRLMKDSTIGYGVIPKNADSFRHRIINAPFEYKLQEDGTYEAEVNENYKSDKETYVQIYDASQMSEKQLKDRDVAIERYENIRQGNELDIKNYDDTLINYIFEIRNWSEYQKRIDVINDLIKSGKNIKLDSPEGSMLACSFSNFKFERDPENHVNWDAQKDMIKMNYFISGYDEKLLQAITDKDERYFAKKMIVRANYEVQDLTLQVLNYQTQFIKDTQHIYTAQQIGSAKTVEAINKLIQDKKLPEEVQLNSEELNNILNGMYMFEPKGVLSKDDATVKALMKLPLDAIEFGENIQGVLSTSYFSNRATNEDTLGVSRFDLLKSKNPHLVAPYVDVYNKVNSLFENEVKDFAFAVVEKINETSSQKLLNTDGSYTEYGEYVIDLVGKDIARYAFLRALSGESFNAKTLKDGEITYDYDAIKAKTTLKSLGITANNPTKEAEMLQKKLEKGLEQLSEKDISFVADAIGQSIAGTDVSSFRIAEAMVNKSGLGLNWRLDAAKDLADMDAGRNAENTFEENWTNIINFWALGVKAIKTINPYADIVAEITDVSDLMRDNIGSEVYPYDGETNFGQMFTDEPAAMIKFFNETGITTEAAYSFLFSSIINSFAREFEYGSIDKNSVPGFSYEGHDLFKSRIDLLMRTKNLDYLRNFYTFVGNHDKPRTIHNMALDMSLFNANLNNTDKRNHQLEALKIVTNVKDVTEIPIELRLHVDSGIYSRTLSSQAAAMSKLLRDVINEDMKEMLSKDDIKMLNEAIADITSGTYLIKGKKADYQVINTKELSSIKDSFETIIEMAQKRGLELSDNDKKELLDTLVKKAKDGEIFDSKGKLKKDKALKDFQVVGDFDSKNDKDKGQRETNIKYAQEILGSCNDYNKYSLYSVQLARLFKNSLKTAGVEESSAITSALVDFVEKYDKNFVKSHSKEVQKFEDPEISAMKNAYAAKDIRKALEMVIRQAEYKSNKEFANKKEIIDTAYKYATEPATAKFAMMMEYLAAIIGNPTIFAGDEMAMTGGEKKAKNIDLQNRNVPAWSETEEQSTIGDYRRAAMTAINGAFSNRSNPELHSLNDGTPYEMDVVSNNKTRNEVKNRIIQITEEVKGNENLKKEERNKLEAERRELTKQLAKVAYLRQSANGDMTVSVLYNGNISHDNRHDYFKDFGLDKKTKEERLKYMEENNLYSFNPDNKYVPILEKVEMDAIMLGAGIALPVGTIFLNGDLRDKTQYIVKKIGKELGLVNADGGKIVMDKFTSRNGVMVLRHLRNKLPSFRGRQQQYNFATNPYKQNEPIVEGQKLSLISK